MECNWSPSSGGVLHKPRIGIIPAPFPPGESGLATRDYSELGHRLKWQIGESRREASSLSKGCQKSEPKVTFDVKAGAYKLKCSKQVSLLLVYVVRLYIALHGGNQLHLLIHIHFIAQKDASAGKHALYTYIRVLPINTMVGIRQLQFTQV